MNDLTQLRKIIKSRNFIPGASNNAFDPLADKILSHLYQNHDFEKIVRVISSELVVNYGLYDTEFDSKSLAGEIFEWWRNK